MKGAAWCQGRLYESQNFRRQPVALEIFGDFMHGRQAALLDPIGRTGDAGTTLARAGAPRGLVESPRPSDIRVLIRRRRAPFHGLRRAYGQRSAPVASTRERRHLAMRHEQQGAFDS
jgi:hypothetical protein